MQVNDTQSVELVNASEAASIIGCSRGYIDILQYKGMLTPIPTTKSRLFFSKNQVEEVKPTLRKNKKKLLNNTRGGQKNGNHD